MTTRRPYTTDSLRRALEHHVRGGRLRAFTHTSGTYRPWSVEGFNYQPAATFTERKERETQGQETTP